jgi:hypothetical protein
MFVDSRFVMAYSTLAGWIGICNLSGAKYLDFWADSY